MTDQRTPRTAAEVTRDWLAGALLVATGSVTQGEYPGRAHYEGLADEVIRWLAEHGFRLAIEAEALDVERLAKAHDMAWSQPDRDFDEATAAAYARLAAEEEAG